MTELDAGGKLNLDGEDGQVSALKDKLKRNVVEAEDAALIVFTAWREVGLDVHDDEIVSLHHFAPVSNIISAEGPLYDETRKVALQGMIQNLIKRH